MIRATLGIGMNPDLAVTVDHQPSKLPQPGNILSDYRFAT
jgi:hypothetical protein